MPLQRLRRLARHLLPGRLLPGRLFPGPALPPADAALRPDPAARKLPGPLRPGAPLPRPPAEAGMLAVVAELAGPATIALAAGGTVHDRLDLPPRPAPWRVALFVPPAPGLRLVCDAAPARATAWWLPQAAVAPDRLVPAIRLAPDPDWPRFYGPPPPEDMPDRLRDRVFAGLAAPALVSLLDGLPLWLEPGDELSRAVMRSGTYEPDTLLAVQALLPPGGTFADIGAHCGLIAAFAARRAARVLAFEPSPREFARLVANLAPHPHATPRRAAIAETAGTAELRLAEPGHAGHNTIGARFAYDGVATAAIATVPALTLDAALAGLERCDLVKMDIEGAELRALRGGAAALARLRPALILEVFARALDPATGGFDTPAGPQPGVSRNIVALPAG